MGAMWALRLGLMRRSGPVTDTRKARACRALLGSGSDGTRTRDLRRDSPRRRKRRMTTTDTFGLQTPRFRGADR
jgi:hypothetical protein